MKQARCQRINRITSKVRPDVALFIFQSLQTFLTCLQFKLISHAEQANLDLEKIFPAKLDIDPFCYGQSVAQLVLVTV